MKSPSPSFLYIALKEAAALTTEYHDFQQIPDPDELMKKNNNIPVHEIMYQL